MLIITLWYMVWEEFSQYFIMKHFLWYLIFYTTMKWGSSFLPFIWTVFFLTLRGVYYLRKTQSILHHIGWSLSLPCIYIRVWKSCVFCLKKIMIKNDCSSNSCWPHHVGKRDLFALRYESWKITLLAWKVTLVYIK
jgi:hypothetical protein